MGDKKMMKKEKNPSPKKAAAGGRRYFKPESERPSFPITVGKRDWGRREFIRVNKSGSGVVTKSWLVPSSSHCNLNRPPRKHSWPQLALIDIPPEIQATNDTGKYSLKGFFHQRQLTLDCSERRPLWGPDYYDLPRDSSVHFRGTESSGSFQFVITGLTSLAFPFPKGVEQDCARKFSYYWRYVSMMKSCTVIEPFSTTDHQYMELTNFIGFGGKYYAISRQGSLAVIEYSKVQRWNLLVFLLLRASVNVVDDVEVFGLDESSLCWKEVEKLPDDTVFFVEDKWCLGVSASLFRCKSGENCVYFTYERGEHWFCFDMKTRRISVSLKFFQLNFI
ncbi:Unknown protein [Striga hermonthica]|uniref:KIB1-4 beta-propeller domain-containing protein n=1 Tax=Striga hermonthica TaxID=68872 RepID=A0A9N7RBW5_STRHE|nr:Unknown protein [Striga hermonthica]